MVKADRSKFSKTKNLLRNIHQSHDRLQTGRAEDEKDGYQAS